MGTKWLASSTYEEQNNFHLLTENLSRNVYSFNKGMFQDFAQVYFTGLLVIYYGGHTLLQA